MGTAERIEDKSRSRAIDHGTHGIHGKGKRRTGIRKVGTAERIESKSRSRAIDHGIHGIHGIR